MPQNFQPLWARKANVKILCSYPHGRDKLRLHNSSQSQTKRNDFSLPSLLKHGRNKNREYIILWHMQGHILRETNCDLQFVVLAFCLYSSEHYPLICSELIPVPLLKLILIPHVCTSLIICNYVEITLFLHGLLYVPPPLGCFL